MLKYVELLQNTNVEKAKKILLGYVDKDLIPFQDIP
jgi:hypothetical protein